MKRIVSLVFFSIIIFSSLKAEEVEFKANAPSTVIQGSRFQLIYTINKSANEIRIPDIPDFQILMGPSISQSSSTQIINNQISRSVQYSYTYVLRADDVGTFNISPAKIETEGNIVESNSLTIEVIPADDADRSPQQQQQTESTDGALSDDDLFITMTANKSEVWQEEAILVTTKIYTRVNLEGISDISLPELRDFLVENLESDEGSIQWSMENIRGLNYRVGTFNQRVLYPQSSGQLTIIPTSIEFLIRQRQARQSHSIFGDFFDSYRTVRKRVTSNSLNIQVKALPSPRPAGYSGIVGNISLNVSPSDTDVKINDGITVKAEISGTGNHRLALNPKFDFPADFDVFEPNVKNNIRQTAQGGRGTKTIETLIIPRYAGIFTIPSVEYSFFNPATGRYQTIKSNPITLNVEGSQIESEDAFISSSPGRAANRENVQMLGQDIRFIRTSPMLLHPVDSFLFGSKTFILGYVIPLFLFIIIYFFNRKRIKENADIQRVKNKKANKIARKRLKRSALLLQKGDQEGFYEELVKALWGYISDKLSISRAELNKDNVRNILISSGGEEILSDEFLRILDTCEYARYSPQNDHKERDELYKKALTTISKLEGQLKRKKVSS